MDSGESASTGFQLQDKQIQTDERVRNTSQGKFDASFLVNVCSEEKADLFVKDLERETGTNFNSFRGNSFKANKNWKHKLLKCARNVREQRNCQSRGQGCRQWSCQGC